MISTRGQRQLFPFKLRGLRGYNVLTGANVLSKDWFSQAGEPIIYGIALIHNKADNAAQVTTIRNLLEEYTNPDGTTYYRFKHTARPHTVKVHHLIPTGITVSNLENLKGDCTVYQSTQSENKMFNRGFIRTLDAGASITDIIDDYTQCTGPKINAGNHANEDKNRGVLNDRSHGRTLSQQGYQNVGLIGEGGSLSTEISNYKTAITNAGFVWS